MKDRKNFQSRAPVEESEAPVEEKKNRTGHITGCELLNVRQNPDSSSLVVAQITSADMLLIRGEDNVSGFFKVTTASGVSGYCMKKYIAFND